MVYVEEVQHGGFDSISVATIDIRGSNLNHRIELIVWHR